jgi:hypothetical protein
MAASFNLRTKRRIVIGPQTSQRACAHVYVREMNATYVYANMYVRVYVCTCVCIYVCMYVRMYSWNDPYLHFANNCVNSVRTVEFMYGCLLIRSMYEGMHVTLCMCLCMHDVIYMYGYIHVRIYTCTDIYMYGYMHVRIYIIIYYRYICKSSYCMPLSSLMHFRPSRTDPAISRGIWDRSSSHTVINNHHYIP